MVQADPPRLNQALTNLIENAIKFTPHGGEVRVSTWCRAGEVGITVADTGPGISPEDREHLFDRFYRVDSARGRGVGGSGLGLAICREIALAHGGHIWVDSERGRGSAFSLALPSWRSLGSENPRVGESSGVPGPEQPTSELVGSAFPRPSEIHRSPRVVPSRKNGQEPGR